MKKKADELEFCRYLQCSNADGTIESSVTVQPYCVGMYVAITLSEGGFMQLTIPHNKIAAWFKASIKKMEKNGNTVTTSIEKLCDYLSIEDINNYILNQ